MSGSGFYSGSGQVPYGGGVNLTPFGHQSAAAPLSAGNHHADTLGRAAVKLEALRSGQFPAVPVGRFLGPMLGASFMGLLAAGFLTLGFTLVIGPAKPVWAALIVFGVFALLCASAAYLLFLDSKPDTPKRAIKLFYKALGRGNAKRAARMVVPNDFDDFPRFQPQVKGFGSGMNPRPFGGDVFFGSYWSELLRYHTSPYCYVNVSSVQVRELGPDLAVVDFKVRFTMNTSLWMLLIFVALLIAVIVDFATRKVVTVQMQKLLYRVGDEWHLFNGEYQGAEEFDLSWLEPAGHAPQVQAPKPTAPWEARQSAPAPRTSPQSAPWESKPPK